MQTRLARIISIIFHPISMPTLAFSILLFLLYQITNLTEQGKIHLLGLIFFSTFLVPVLSIFMLYKSGLISSLEMKNRKERIIPFVFTTLFFAILSYMLFGKMSPNSAISSLMAGITLMMCLLTIITLFYKVSIHACGISSILGFLCGIQYQYPSLDLFYPILIFIVLVGLVLTARLRLKAHTLGELILGTVIGFAGCFTLMVSS